MKKYYWLTALIAVILVLGIAYFFVSNKSTDQNTISPLPENTAKTETTLLSPYGKVTIKLGQQASFKGISIRPTAVLEDSRCPIDVQCIQAGTVKVNVETVVSNGATTNQIVSLGNSVIVDTFSISLNDVEPQKKSDTVIANSDYSFTFEVHQSSVPVSPEENETIAS